MASGRPNRLAAITRALPVPVGPLPLPVVPVVPVVMVPMVVSVVVVPVVVGVVP